VTHKLRFDVLTPNVEKPGENITCGLNEILNKKLECVDLFAIDIIQSHMNTTDLHAFESDTTFNIPAMFGDDFAYTNASHNFLFINTLSLLL
jgi:hypothetical protein